MITRHGKKGFTLRGVAGGDSHQSAILISRAICGRSKQRGGRARRTTCINNLKHDRHWRFSNLRHDTQEGIPVGGHGCGWQGWRMELSRCALLPYMEYGGMYDQLNVRTNTDPAASLYPVPPRLRSPRLSTQAGHDDHPRVELPLAVRWRRCTRAPTRTTGPWVRGLVHLKAWALRAEPICTE